MTATARLTSAIRPLLLLGLCLLFSSGAAFAKDHTEQVRQLKKDVKQLEEQQEEQQEEQEKINETVKGDIEKLQDTDESYIVDIRKNRNDTDANRDTLKTLKSTILHMEDAIKASDNKRESNTNEIDVNKTAIDKVRQELRSSTRDVRANAADLSTQKSLIEDNSIRLYEILIQIRNNQDRADELDTAIGKLNNVDQQEDIKASIGTDLQRIWLFFAIVLVFFAPLAFVVSNNRDNYKPLRDGTPQHQGVILACMGVFLGYFLVGFSVMYGETTSGWVGASSYLGQVGDPLANIASEIPLSEFILYQSGFVMFAALVVYVTVGRQLSGAAHMFLAIFVGAVLIPVFGHWTWSSHFISDNKGWLENMGFIDQAGAATISAVAAWFAFFIIWKLGRSAPPPQDDDQPSHGDPVYSSSAVLLLWLSWIGFTTGTLSLDSGQIPSVILNAGLAAAAGGLMAFVHYIFFHSDKSRVARALGGFVSGLVAIAACAQSVTFAEAAAIGAIAGLLQNIAYESLRKNFLPHSWQIRAAYLVAIHGVAGLWGIFSVALFGSEENFAAPDFILLATQAQGAAIVVAYGMVMASLIMLVLPTGKKKAAATDVATTA